MLRKNVAESLVKKSDIIFTNFKKALIYFTLKTKGAELINPALCFLDVIYFLSPIGNTVRP